jgi:hypothetical protein
MATFTHTITWTVNIEGVSTLYKYTYQIADIDDVERVNASPSTQSGVFLTYRNEPVLVATVAKGGNGGKITITENAGPTSIDARYTGDGDLVVFHLSDGGGTWNQSASDATTTLRANDRISVLSYPGSIDILVLHQPGS